MNVGNRFQRQLGILNPEKCNERVNVIGAGATGSFATLALAKMGMTNIVIYDADKVEEHNFPNQLFPVSAMGKNKAIAVKEIVKEYTETDIEAVPEMYENQPLSGIVISALDSMSGRSLIYKNSCDSGKVKLLIDPRTGPEMFRLLTLDPNILMLRPGYEKHLFKDEDADEAPCTARSIIYSVMLVSSFVCSQVKKYIMDQEYKRDIYIDMSENFSFFD